MGGREGKGREGREWQGTGRKGKGEDAMRGECPLPEIRHWCCVHHLLFSSKTCCKTCDDVSKTMKYIIIIFFTKSSVYTLSTKKQIQVIVRLIILFRTGEIL